MSDDATSTDLQTESSRRGAGLVTAAVTALVVAALCGLTVLLGAVTGASRTCAGCHSPQAKALASTGHAAVACRTCHLRSRGPVLGRIDVITRMVPASLNGSEITGPGHLIGRSACLSCHLKVMEGPVKRDGLRINHRFCAAKGPCDSCHGQSAHADATRIVRRPSMSECVACHLKERAPTACALCHEGKLSLTRSRDPEWARTHGPDWKRLHGTGDLESCNSCHTPDKCRACHGIDFPHPVGFGSSHGKLAVKAGQTACLTCHKRSTFCSSCHGIKMPHPTGFLQEHSRIALSTDDSNCMRCHVTADCQLCHDYHVHPGGTKPPVGRTGEGRK